MTEHETMGEPTPGDPTVTAKLTSSFEETTVGVPVPGSGAGSSAGTTVDPSSATRSPAPPGTARPPEIPDVQFEKLLGRGGMGAVFRGRQVTLDRQVAVKVIHPDLARDESFVKRFEREAKVLAKLAHPNIVACYQAGKANTGEHYLLMEFVEGQDLRQQVQRSGVLSERDALAITKQVAEALAHALEAGVIHRDVKPENILLKKLVAQRTTGRIPPSTNSLGVQAKLVDLGLASLARVDQEAAKITQAGTAVGTPVTMAPEQAEAPETIDHRADIYALGCTLYYALTAKFPHEGGTVAQVIARKLRDETPSPKRYRENLSDPVVALVLRMMAFDVGDRPKTYDELTGLIDVAITGTPDFAPSGPTTPSDRSAVATAETVARVPVGKRATATAVSTPRASGSRVPVIAMSLVALVAIGGGVAVKLSKTDHPEPPKPTPTSVAASSPTPAPVATPVAGGSSELEPRPAIWESASKFFGDPKNLFAGWTPTPASAWQPLDVNSEVNADIQVVLDGDTTLAKLSLDDVPKGNWCLKAEVYPLNASEVGGYVEAGGGVTGRFAIQTLGAKTVTIKSVRVEGTADPVTVDVLGLEYAQRPLEIRFEWIDGSIWGQVVGAKGVAKGKPKAWVHLPLTPPITHVGLYARKSPGDGQQAADFASVKLEPERK